MSVRNAQGTTVEFATSAFTGEIVDIAESSERGELDTTTLGTTDSATYIPATLDRGTFTMAILYEVNDEPPLKADTESITVTYPLAGAEATNGTDEFDGFITNVNKRGAVDDLLRADVTVRRTGPITHTDPV